ncbi:LysR substrate-binding domain-containing protein [Aquamicrobium sp.]|uniref:LysR substrate-binding domain-containing protein n=1 Tax=Aquamicrobium sp. TaxID=1872579 RepID=UPI00258934BC|nr:LysR substrate-binding domain-containing protein [Aquamicrobium sp.]MCK9553596.1 LysR substrate-binding domain-containing protein [Aquamicrobium sp.]
MRPIPPLNPLHVFEVAARLGNFTKAAKELRVTQSAVSRQISTLEDYLGAKLFHRENKGTILTEDGSAYYSEIGPAFGVIARATDGILAQYKSNIVRVSCYPTFASKWLIPRLAGFNEKHRNIEVKLETKVISIRQHSNPYDVAVNLCGPEDVDPQYSSLLFEDVIQPFCSPSFLARHKMNSIEDLLSVKRLTSHYRRRDWQDWFEAKGLIDMPDEGDVFLSSLLTYKAASEGLGIAICQHFLVTDEMRAGLLVPVFSPVTRNLAHFVVWNKNANYRARTFVKWLQDEISRSSDVEG